MGTFGMDVPLFAAPIPHVGPGHDDPLEAAVVHQPNERDSIILGSSADNALPHSCVLPPWRGPARARRRRGQSARAHWAPATPPPPRGLESATAGRGTQSPGAAVRLQPGGRGPVRHVQRCVEQSPTAGSGVDARQAAGGSGGSSGPHLGVVGRSAKVVLGHAGQDQAKKQPGLGNVGGSPAQHSSGCPTSGWGNPCHLVTIKTCCRGLVTRGKGSSCPKFHIPKSGPHVQGRQIELP